MERKRRFASSFVGRLPVALLDPDELLADFGLAKIQFFDGSLEKFILVDED